MWRLTKIPGYTRTKTRPPFTNSSWWEHLQPIINSPIFHRMLVILGPGHKVGVVRVRNPAPASFLQKLFLCLITFHHGTWRRSSCWGSLWCSTPRSWSSWWPWCGLLPCYSSPPPPSRPPPGSGQVLSWHWTYLSPGEVQHLYRLCIDHFHYTINSSITQNAWQ